MPASEFLPIVPVGDLGGPGQISGQGGRAVGIECRSGILGAAFAVGSHHTGTFPAGCGCSATLEKHWLVSLKKRAGRRRVEGGNSPCRGPGPWASALGSPSSSPLLPPLAPHRAGQPVVWKPGAVLKPSQYPWFSPPSSSLSLLVQVLETHWCSFGGKQVAVPQKAKQTPT